MPLRRALPCLSLFLLVAAGTSFAQTPTLAADTPPPAQLGLTADDVRHHLGHVIDWYHRLGGLAPHAALIDDVATRERLHQLRLTEVRLAFVFGRAAAPLAVDAPAAATTTDTVDPQPYAESQARLQQREDELRAELARIDARFAAAPAAEREVLAAQRARLTAALTLTGEVQATQLRLQQFAARSNSRASGQTGLLADITDMERTVPEARLAGGPPPAAGEDASAAEGRVAASARRDSGGIIALANEWYELRDSLGLHQHFIDATDALSEALDTLSKGLAGEVRELLRTASATAATTDARSLTGERKAIESATARFRELSTLLIPLGEESITLDSVREVLDQRRAGLERRSNAIARQLLVSAALLVTSVAVILGISAVWRRATFRYLHDSRRRRQFLTLRRVTTGAALVIVGFVAFLSEVGSLATYIGFLTAGLAVALQNVILAVVAYFFLIGRYGVRVGDRITMAGVTGRVAEIGLVRLYLTELAGPELTPSGRMIVLSNAVVFQPQALFKQLPGVDYTWHSLTITLAPSVDLQLARTRLLERATAVYEQHRESIEHNLRAARHLVDFDSLTPSPEVNVRFAEHGAEVTIRYPVLPDQAALVDQQMSRALREAVDEEPRLPLAGAADASPAG
jgi:small-conductance mechanosensitive channel